MSVKVYVLSCKSGWKFKYFMLTAAQIEP